MHELSIATSILDLARKHVPAGSVLTSVKIESGPMRGIEPHAMEFAWQACTSGSDAEGSAIEVVILPWQLRCAACGRQFQADDVYAPCSCGAGHGYPCGDDVLRIVSIEVTDKSAGSRQPAPQV